MKLEIISEGKKIFTAKETIDIIKVNWEEPHDEEHMIYAIVQLQKTVDLLIAALREQK